MSNKLRPTKKQTEMLGFIESFIAEHGYSPSYREIRNGCNYNSVATVASHVDNLIKRGHLQKREHAARSLELTNSKLDQTLNPKPSSFINKVQARFSQAEAAPKLTKKQVDDLYVLTGAAKVLGYAEAENFKQRLLKLKSRS